MKWKVVKKYFLILFLSVFIVNNTFASPGRLRKDSIINCNGSTYGQHLSNGALHWHVAAPASDGGYNAAGDPIYSDPCNSGATYTPPAQNYTPPSQSYTPPAQSYTPPAQNYTPTPDPAIQDSDNSLKAVSVNSKSIDVAEKMSHEMNSDKLNIEATANSDKASVEILNKPDALLENRASANITIKVTSENGSSKSYMLTVTRVFSSNTKISSISVNDKSVEVSDNMSISIDSSVVKIEVTPAGKMAKVDFIKNVESIKTEGLTKTAIFRITAQDGTTKDYRIKIKRGFLQPSIDLYLNDERQYISESYTTEIKYGSLLPTKIVFAYELKPKSAMVKIFKGEHEIGDEDTLSYGGNDYNIKITSASGKEHIYKLKLIKQNPLEVILGAALILIAYDAFIFAVMYFWGEVLHGVKNSKKAKKKRYPTSKQVLLAIVFPPLAIVKYFKEADVFYRFVLAFCCVIFVVSGYTLLFAASTATQRGDLIGREVLDDSEAEEEEAFFEIHPELK